MIQLEVGPLSSNGRSPGEGDGNPLQYSCLENPMDRRARLAIVHRVATNWTRLKQLSTHTALLISRGMAGSRYSDFIHDGSWKEECRNCQFSQTLGMELAQCHLHHTPFDFYWMIVALQRCVRFCPTAKGISYMRTCAQCFSCVQLFVTLWTVACQAPLSMGFSRQVYWSGLPCPPPEDLPHLGMEPTSLMSPTLAAGFFTTAPRRKPICIHLSSLQISFPFRSPESTEENSLCCAGSCSPQVSISDNSGVYRSNPIYQFIPPHSSPLVSISLSSPPVSLSLLCK